MNASQQTPKEHNNVALWITVIAEAVTIVAIGAYNIYEIRRHSALVETKIERLSEYSARQGEKVDRMLTLLELYLGKKLDAAEEASSNSPVVEERIDKAIEFLETLKKKEDGRE